MTQTHLCQRCLDAEVICHSRCGHSTFCPTCEAHEELINLEQQLSAETQRADKAERRLAKADNLADIVRSYRYDDYSAPAILLYFEEMSDALDAYDAAMKED